MKTAKLNIRKRQIKRPFFQGIASLLFVLMFTALTGFQSFAHCDSYDGPVIKDALKALKQNKVELVLKWVEPKYEKEITAKFNQTLKLTGNNKEVNKILETHFLETLVRLHREGEGEPYTGLKPAGSVTPIIQLADESILKSSADDLLIKLKAHIESDLRTKYLLVEKLNKTKDNSLEEGRAYVAAYVAYTHTLESLEIVLNGHQGHTTGKH